MTKNYIGNGTTIIKFISMAIAGWAISTLAAYGLNLTVDTSTFAEVIGAFIGMIVGYLDAKYPNTFGFLGNAPVPDEDDAGDEDEE